MKRKLYFLYLSSILSTVHGIHCWQCASTSGKVCPYQAKPVLSSGHDACIVWRHGNGSILLQNLVVSQNECTEDRVSFWSKFVDLYYKTYGGSVSCCYTDNCNDGRNFPRLPPPRVSPVLSSSIFSGTRAPVSALPNPAFLPTSGSSLNNVESWPKPHNKRNGNCELYYEKVKSDEWVPDTLVPLAFDRASEAKVGVFFTKFSEELGSNDYVTVRILNKAKQNLSMYSVNLYRADRVSIHISRLEPPRNGGDYTRQEGSKESENAVLDLDNSTYKGFWISVRNGIEISVGRIGDKLIDSIANYTDVIREGPDAPYYFGLTTPETTSAFFGVNCDMPGLHFEDTCVTDDDCVDFPNTVCMAEPVNKGLDPGIRRLPFEKWKEGDTLLKSCWCKEGHIRIPQSEGCYDPIRKVVTLQDACFADYHCNDLPNTICSQDMLMPLYNMSCQCIPGNKPFEKDPRTGLVEGCAPLTNKDKTSIDGCSRRFTIKDKAEWVPETVFPMSQDTFAFFVTLGSPDDVGNREDDTAVIRLLDEKKDKQKMYSIKIYREEGKIALYESKITRSFFFENENDREVAQSNDLQTFRKLELGYVGFWVQYKYEEGYGGQISVGLSGSPLSSDYAILKWTDTGTTALPTIKYIGFTNGARQHSIDYGANCVLLKTNYGVNPAYYNQGYQQPLYQPPYPHTTKATYNTNPQVVQQSPQINPWDLLTYPAPGPVRKTVSKQAASPWSQQRVIQPVLKSQYLTKLHRLLPTFLEEGESASKLEDLLHNRIV
jgi:hypothetical protein